MGILHRKSKAAVKCLVGETKCLLSDHLAASVGHSQAQKCLQINPKPLYQSCYEILKIMYSTEFSTDCLPDLLTNAFKQA